MEITYPYYDASTGVTKEEAAVDLKYLEDKYMEGWMSSLGMAIDRR